MTKATIPTTAVAVENLESLYRLALKDEIFGGMGWYTIALAECDKIAKEYGISLLQAVGVVAALSPQMPWKRNIPVARGCIVQFQNSLPMRGHTQSQMAKVRAILAAGPLATRLEIARMVWGTGDKFKTINFYYDILGVGPDADGLGRIANCGVTIDRWAAAACVGQYINTIDMPNLNKVRYIACADAYIAMAARHNMEPAQMQAIIWVVIRRLNGVVD